MAENHQQVSNPCAEFGPTQWKALFWCIGAIAFGFWLTFFLSHVDAKMYATNAEVIDNKAYQENRLATTSIANEKVDPRSFSSLSAVKTLLLDRR